MELKDESKLTFAAIVIVCITSIQICAFIFGFNGQVFAFTSLIIGGIVGSIFGFSITKKAGK